MGPASKPENTPKRVKKSGQRANAETMAARQREISVSEFFTKNRHLLGFDNPAKALLTTVKEATDNSLDACDEAGILPTLKISISEVSEDRYQVVVEDNGPGIVKQQIPKIFGKLLYGSKFHRLKQSRGQQGIGISAAGMYGQLTTGKPAIITSKTGAEKPANRFAIVLNTQKNKPDIVDERTVEWSVEHGTRVEIELEGIYKGGRRSIDEYLEQVAIANPHAELTYAPPKGKAPLHLPRVTDDLPQEPAEIKPHPYGVELGMLINLLKESKKNNLGAALQSDFSRVTSRVAGQICDLAGIRRSVSPRRLDTSEIEKIYQAIQKVKILAPRTDCVVPIGEDLIQRGLGREIKAGFCVSSTRPPAVYRGNPFRIEVGLAYGGELRREEVMEESDHLKVKAVDRAEGPITLIRFANRVPLQYQQSGCAIFKAVVDTNWKQYGLAQPKGSLPIGPMVLLVHMASVWVPFTSESKEAVAHYPEIIKEIKLGLRDCGRKLVQHLRRKERAQLEARRRSIFSLYVGELAISLSHLSGYDVKKLHKKLEDLADEHSGDADLIEETGISPTVEVEEEKATKKKNTDGEEEFEERATPKRKKIAKKFSKKSSSQKKGVR
ncbi:MAG: DNA topoisomerase VI subunit B [Pseudomonadota bacterium]